MAGCLSVPTERLTRHEISWLLAQEARGAAKTLRTEVDQLRAPGEVRPGGPPVETALDALEDTIEMLSTLNTGTRGKGRRGRIDLASLLFEIAPNARVAIAPGAGTEVFGEELELRRMLHLLVGQAGGRVPAEAEIEVKIRRQGDFVRISADLGPDTAALGELERRWLSRMALRHGGSVELEGGTHSILLQADGAIDQREVTELRKELEQAQQLGEAYARELASVLSVGDVRTESPPAERGDPERAQGVRSLATATQRALRGLLDGLRLDLESRGASSPEVAHDALQRLGSGQELIAELGSFADLPAHPEREVIDISAEVSAAIAQVEGRAARAQVTLDAKLVAGAELKIPRAPLGLLIRSLLLHAIAATPRGGSISLALYRTELGVALSVIDGGPSIAEASRWDVIRHQTDPTRLGRPTGVSLVLADALAIMLSADLELRESAAGHTEAWVAFRKG
jgi:two-component system OmpR family sensor kinase